MTLLTRKPIVVPWDFSEMSKRALETAVELGGEIGQIHVLHVIPYPPSMEPGVIWGVVDEESLTQKAAESFRKEISEAKFPGVNFKVMFGDPGTQVAKLAKDLDAGLVVISSHGRTGLAHFFLGSVAERVTRLSPCPVLVLRGH
jgi:nucleotide-binding universal stress UspA family protein